MHEHVVVVVLIIKRNDVTTNPHGTIVADLRLKKALCIPGGTVLTPIHKVQTEQTEFESNHQKSRDGRSLLHGMALWRDTLDGGPNVSDNCGSIVGISQWAIDEFPGMWAKPTCTPQNERDKIDVGSEFSLLLLSWP